MGNKLCYGVDIQGDEESGWLFNVLDFCDRQTRKSAPFVTKRYCNIFTTEASFRWRMERLHIEHGIYFPRLLPKDHTWKSLFLELDKKRHLWEADDVVVDADQQVASNNVNGNKYSISVFVRLKPFTHDYDRTPGGRKAVLPLHQRLALIRIDKCLSSNKQALCVLKEQGGWFKEKWDEIEQASLNVEQLTGKDQHLTDSLQSGIKMIDCANSRIIVVDKGLREFEFDGVYKDDASQRDVYNISTHELICDVVNGVSATCLVYGQTGSGKTFTMFGAQEEGELSSTCAGIVPRACSELMTTLEHRKNELNLKIEYDVCVSFVEVYGNEILDLLQKGKRVSQSKVSAQRSVLDGSAEVPVTNVSEVMRLLNIGEAQKRKAATAMNLRSSRAHAVFIVTVKQKCFDSGKSISSKLFLADLGGCEQTKKSDLAAGKSKHIEALKGNRNDGQTDAMLQDTKGGEYSVGFVKSDRMREAVYINLGLMSLKSCVEALTRGAYVPYSNSKLTMLLSSGLGGNSKTAVIVCASQEDEHASETINAFKFGQACRRVSNTVRTQADVLGDLMMELDIKIAACQERIRMNEKWVVQEQRFVDDLAEKGTLEAEGFGGFEVRKTIVLVGAEKDRKLLHRLLSKRSELSGSTSTFSDKTLASSGASFGGNIGFGNAHEYELGQMFSSDADKENYRFSDQPSDDLVPEAVKSKKSEAVAAMTAKKGRLAYSGISA